MFNHHSKKLFFLLALWCCCIVTRHCFLWLCCCLSFVWLWMLIVQKKDASQHYGQPWGQGWINLQGATGQNRSAAPPAPPPSPPITPLHKRYPMNIHRGGIRLSYARTMLKWASVHNGRTLQRDFSHNKCCYDWNHECYYLHMCYPQSDMSKRL